VRALLSGMPERQDALCVFFSIYSAHGFVKESGGGGERTESAIVAVTPK